VKQTSIIVLEPSAGLGEFFDEDLKCSFRKVFAKQVSLMIISHIDFCVSVLMFVVFIF
jgi:hypothetical protein